MSDRKAYDNKRKINMIGIDGEVIKVLFYETEKQAIRHVTKLTQRVDWGKFSRIELIDITVFGIETILKIFTQAE